MPSEAVQNLIGRAVMDEEFRKLLFSDPEKALEGYDLTPQEKKFLLSLDPDEVADFAGKLDERITKVKMRLT